MPAKNYKFILKMWTKSWEHPETGNFQIQLKWGVKTYKFHYEKDINRIFAKRYRKSQYYPKSLDELGEIYWTPENKHYLFISETLNEVFKKYNQDDEITDERRDLRQIFRLIPNCYQ